MILLDKRQVLSECEFAAQMDEARASVRVSMEQDRFCEKGVVREHASLQEHCSLLLVRPLDVLRAEVI